MGDELCDPDHLFMSALFSESIYGHDEDETFHSRRTSAKASLIRSAYYDILVWCGTKDFRDILIDLSAVPWKYNGYWVHSGFALQHASLWKKIRPHIDQYKPLIITGHSLGGALAELTVPYTQGMKEVELYTFGKPNVFAKWNHPYFYWLKHQVSVVSGSDAVTRSPRFMYRPSSGQKMLYLANNGLDVWNPTKKYRRDDYKFSDILEDHSMKMYLNRCKAHKRVLG